MKRHPQGRRRRALATACLAVQGQGGDWDAANAEHTALAGRVATCKGRAAYAVLSGLLDFHRRHPAAKVRLAATTGGAPVCGYRIAAVDTGGDGEVRPGDTAGIELADTYVDHAELLRDASVSIGAVPVPGVPVLKSASGDRLVLSVVVPALEPGPADIAVRHAGTEVRLSAALTVTVADVEQEPGTGPGAPGETASPPQAPAPAADGPASSLAAPAPAHGRPGVWPEAQVPPPGASASPLTASMTDPRPFPHLYGTPPAAALLTAATVDAPAAPTPG